MTKFKYFEVTTTNIVKAPAVKEVKKIPPFVQAAIAKKKTRITATEKINYIKIYNEPETVYWLEAVKKLLNIK